jgi:hypothetical protein
VPRPATHSKQTTGEIRESWHAQRLASIGPRLDALAARIAVLESSDCAEASADTREMVRVIIEQGRVVVADNDASMAGDILTFVDEAERALDLVCPTPTP